MQHANLIDAVPNVRPDPAGAPAHRRWGHVLVLAGAAAMALAPMALLALVLLAGMAGGDGTGGCGGG